MFEQKEDLTPFVDAAWELVEQHNRGDVILWSKFEDACKCGRWEGRFGSIIDKIRRRLRKERKIVSLTARDVGMRLLTEEEAFTEIPLLRQRQARKRVNRGLAEMRCIDGARLSVHQRRALNFQVAAMQEERLALSRSTKAHRKATNQMIPRRPVAVN